MFWKVSGIGSEVIVVVAIVVPRMQRIGCQPD